MAFKKTRLSVETLEDRCVPSTSPHLPVDPREISVMSRNVYVGADFAPVFNPAAPGGPIFQTSVAWDHVKRTNFPLRAEALADEIAANLPDLIGLQEVSAWYSGPADGGPFFGAPATHVEYDYLTILRDALSARGLHYGVAAEVNVFDEELPIFPDLTKPLIPANMMDFRLIDRDVILARTDVPSSELKLSNPQTGHYTSHVVSNLTVTGFPPVAISFDRGWAAVDVKVRGKDFRFISTHLEPEETAPSIQVAQANELLAGPAGTTLPVLMVGDYNSRADGAGTATYANFIAAGFTDSWSEAHPGQPGYTNGHTELLNNRLDTATEFDRRIDLVLYRGDFRTLNADVVGEETADFDAHGIWPSDHAGVVATLQVHAPPTVESIQINDGSVQRSMVRSIAVSFSEAVTLDAGAFEIVSHGGADVGVHVASSLINGTTSVILTFSGHDIVAGSLADGEYRLVIHANCVRDALGNKLDGNRDGDAGGNAQVSFFRLFGDSDGDADVDLHDLARFARAFNTHTGDADFVSYFDVNGDGRIFATDLIQFVRRLGRRI